MCSKPMASITWLNFELRWFGFRVQTYLCRSAPSILQLPSSLVCVYTFPLINIDVHIDLLINIQNFCSKSAGPNKTLKPDIKQATTFLSFKGMDSLSAPEFLSHKSLRPHTCGMDYTF